MDPHKKTMKIQKENCYVITGGPGVGKTTLINKLKKNGFNTIPENAREIIKQQMEKGGVAVPWKNKALYAKLMLKASIADYNSIHEFSGITFFDRAIPDTLCYMDMIGYNFEQADHLGYSNLYNRNVLMLPPWFEIYQTDNERKQTWEEAQFTYLKMKETYLKYNYNVITVPAETVENRVKFILKCLSIDQIQSSL